MRGATRGMVAAGLAMSALAGCYNAHPAAGAPCDLALDNCPTGQHCTMTAGGAFCYGPNTGFGPDSGNGSGDPDGPRPDNAPSCYGTGLVNNVCGLMPMNDVAITAARTINTAMVGGTNCDQIIAGGGASICLVVARDFSIASGITLSATGANPLVIVGTSSISIAGTLDVASHSGGADGPGTQASCGTGIDGAQGNGTATNGGGGGGGAGGSFGTAGGGGGTGNQGSAGGTPLAAVTPSSLTSLVGGCPGGKGGNGRGMPNGGLPSGGGPGGHGGGAVYLITAGTMTISGVINASGAGGGAGTDGYDSGGGGGGGAGGFIGLDTPTLTVTGAVYANGGSGGGGNGNDIQFHGGPGNDPSSPTVPAVGGAAGQNGGGAGGDGYAGGVAAKKGNNATGQYSAGGAGGGGGGIIRLYGTSAANGTFSPPPS